MKMACLKPRDTHSFKISFLTYSIGILIVEMHPMGPFPLSCFRSEAEFNLISTILLNQAIQFKLIYSIEIRLCTGRRAQRIQKWYTVFHKTKLYLCSSSNVIITLSFMILQCRMHGTSNLIILTHTLMYNKERKIHPFSFGPIFFVTVGDSHMVSG